MKIVQQNHSHEVELHFRKTIVERPKYFIYLFNIHLSCRKVFQSLRGAMLKKKCWFKNFSLAAVKLFQCQF